MAVRSVAKRSSIRRADGTFDRAALTASIKSSVAYAAARLSSRRHLTRSLFSNSKIGRGFDAFERNTGAAHPLAKSLNNKKRASTGSDALTDDAQELWYGEISVGTPAKTFTGSFNAVCS